MKEVIKKPWGAEWLCYESDSVACWMLDIDHGASTSLHSHPGKLTGYILLSGVLRLSFLNGSQMLSALDKAVIHPHVPHRSQAISPVRLIEIEAPKDHDCLIRFEDAYGRSGRPQEIPSKPTKEPLQLARGQLYDFGAGIGAQLETVAPRGYPGFLATLADRAVVAILSGSLVDENGRAGVVPGHVLWGMDLRRIAGVLELKEDLEILTAWENLRVAI